MTLLVLLAVLAVVAIVGTLVAVVRDGVHPVTVRRPTDRIRSL